MRHHHNDDYDIDVDWDSPSTVVRKIFKRPSYAVLIIFIEQRDVLLMDQSLLCSLLCTSKSVRDAVLTSCKGQANILFGAKDLKHVRRFCSWLQRHACLIKELEWNIKGWPDIMDIKTAEASIAAGLKAAAANQQLLVQHYACPLASNVSFAILKQLGASSSGNAGSSTGNGTPTSSGAMINGGSQDSTGRGLRSAAIECHYASEGPPPAAFRACWHDVLDDAKAALSSLHSLQSLSISSPSISKYARQLSSLSQLTHLQLVNRKDHSALCPKHLQSLPAGLIELEVDLCEKDAGRVDLDLSHLTALHTLTLTGKYCMSARDVLPENLKAAVLRCAGASLTPLIGARGLQVLEMGPTCVLPYGDLLELHRKLKHLTELLLSYSTHEEALNLARESTAWPSLPICQLSISRPFAKVTKATTQRFAQLNHRLTSLQLLHCVVEDMPREFSRHLEQLTGLRELNLHRMFEVPGKYQTCFAGMQPLFKVVAGLPNLEVLSISSMAVPATALKELAALGTKLLRLGLNDCGLTDEVLFEICKKCTRLRKLDITGNRQLTNLALGIEPPEDKSRPYWYSRRYLTPVKLPHLVTLKAVGTGLTAAVVEFCPALQEVLATWTL